MAHMLHCLFFLEARFNLSLSEVHVPGVENKLADAISHNNLGYFFDLFPQAQKQACQPPSALVDHLVSQEHWTSDVGAPGYTLCLCLSQLLHETGVCLRPAEVPRLLSEIICHTFSFDRAPVVYLCALFS